MPEMTCYVSSGTLNSANSCFNGHLIIEVQSCLFNPVVIASIASSDAESHCSFLLYLTHGGRLMCLVSFMCQPILIYYDWPTIQLHIAFGARGCKYKPLAAYYEC